MGLGLSGGLRGMGKVLHDGQIITTLPALASIGDLLWVKVCLVHSH